MLNNIIQIIINFSQALGPIQHLVSGMAYIIGIIFIFSGLSKLYVIGSASISTRGGSENSFVPMSYIVGGAALIYAPSTFQTLTATVFGTGSVLQYATTNPVNIITAMFFLIQTAGLVWFIRGCVLVVIASQPGVQEGPKGMVFIVAGILAMNIETTAAVLSTLVTDLVGLF